MPLTETPAVPPFRLMLRAGWEEPPADRASIGVLLERSSTRPATTSVHSCRPPSSSSRLSNVSPGRRAAIVLPPSDPEIAAGRLTYVFDAAQIAVSGTADSARDAGFMAPFPDELVRGIRLEAA